MRGSNGRLEVSGRTGRTVRGLSVIATVLALVVAAGLWSAAPAAAADPSMELGARLKGNAAASYKSAPLGIEREKVVEMVEGTVRRAIGMKADVQASGSMKGVWLPCWNSDNVFVAIAYGKTGPGGQQLFGFHTVVRF